MQTLFTNVSITYLCIFFKKVPCLSCRGLSVLNVQAWRFSLTKWRVASTTLELTPQPSAAHPTLRLNHLFIRHHGFIYHLGPRQHSRPSQAEGTDKLPEKETSYTGCATVLTKIGQQNMKHLETEKVQEKRKGGGGGGIKRAERARVHSSGW